jgi:hypothetical protein
MQLQHSPRFPSDGDGGSRSAVMTSAWAAATAAALTTTLGVAAASWVVAVRLMNGMDMGAETGSVRSRSSSPCGRR